MEHEFSEERIPKNLGTVLILVNEKKREKGETGRLVCAENKMKRGGLVLT